MGQWIVSLEGTEAGRALAVSLALTAALLHAVVSAMQKARYDPWTARAAIDFSYCLMAAPFALLVVPFPESHMWPIFGAALLAHSAYKIFQAMAYSRGAFTLVYPVVRGTGPLITVAAAGIVFGEAFTIGQWVGVLILVSGIFGLAAYNLSLAKFHRGELIAALGLALATGFCVAGYTTVDAYGLRSTADPFTFLAWLFFLDGFLMPALCVARRGVPSGPEGWRLLKFGVVGGAIAVGSFGSVMLATRVGTVGETAVLRETSAVFAAVIGWTILKEPVGMRRLALILLIAAGAVVVELGRW